MIHSLDSSSSAPVSNTSSDELAHFQNKYGNLKFNSKPFSSIEQTLGREIKHTSGSNNVLIDPKALAKMKKDPSFAKKIEKTIEALQGKYSSDPGYAADGYRILTRGFIIDENGELGGGWFTTNEPKKDETEDEKTVNVASQATTYDEIMKDVRQKLLERLNDSQRQSHDIVEISFREETNVESWKEMPNTKNEEPVEQKEKFPQTYI